MKRIVVVGTGSRSALFLDELVRRDDCELVALCDRYPTRAAVAARQINRQDVPRFTELEECLDSVECDAIINCTYDGEHAKTTIPALARGKFVYLEKPLDITRENCQSIIDADRTAGGKTYVGFNLRHAPLYKKLKELIDEGILGKVLTIQADEFYSGGRTYFRRWNRLREISGGLWITKACHDFDLLQWLAGRKPVSVAAFSHLTVYRPTHDYPLYCSDCDIIDTCPDAFKENRVDGRSLELIKGAVQDGMTRPDLCLFNSDKDTLDHGVAIVDFESDIVATYTLSVVAGFTNRRIRVGGTKATVDGDLNSQQLFIQYINPRRTETITASETTDGHGGADKYLLPDFFAFMDGTRKPLVTPEEAMISVVMGRAATESCDTGRLVQIAL